jgi:hypothetical protein
VPAGKSRLATAKSVPGGTLCSRCEEEERCWLCAGSELPEDAAIDASLVVGLGAPNGVVDIDLGGLAAA